MFSNILMLRTPKYDDYKYKSDMYFIKCYMYKVNTHLYCLRKKASYNKDNMSLKLNKWLLYCHCTEGKRSY